MRTESTILGGVAVFLVVAAAVYWFWSYEDAGTVLLVLGAAFTATVAVYLRRLDRRPAPSDDQPATTMSAGDHDPGWFPTTSLWPLGTAGGAVLMGVGLVFGVWLTLVGGALFAASALGFALADRISPPDSTRR